MRLASIQSSAGILLAPGRTVHALVDGAELHLHLVGGLVLVQERLSNGRWRQTILQPAAHRGLVMVLPEAESGELGVAAEALEGDGHERKRRR